MGKRTNKSRQKKETPHNLVRLHDYMVYKSSYFLSPVTTKVLYYAIAKRFAPGTPVEQLQDEIFIPLRELSKAIVETDRIIDTAVIPKSSNSLYETVESVVMELANLKFIFPSELIIDGHSISKVITVCPEVSGAKGKNNEKGIAIKFNESVNPLLFKLQKYVLVYRTEINKLGSGYSIRFYQMLRGIINRKKKFGLIHCTETISLEDLHFILNTRELECYKEFKHFNQNVIKKAVKDINKNTSIQLEIQLVRTLPKVKEGESRRRKTTHILLLFHDADLIGGTKTGKNFVPTEIDLEHLTFAETIAYNMLVKFGVVEGIAFRQIIPCIEGSESIGFEDYFVQATLNHFTKYSKNQDKEDKKIATYVNWWTKHKYFSIGNDVWSKINEEVIKMKKQLQLNYPAKFNNRVIAKDMSASEFKEKYWSKIPEAKNKIIPILNKSENGEKKQ